MPKAGAVSVSHVHSNTSCHPGASDRPRCVGRGARPQAQRATSTFSSTLPANAAPLAAAHSASHATTAAKDAATESSATPPSQGSEPTQGTTLASATTASFATPVAATAALARPSLRTHRFICASGEPLRQPPRPRVPESHASSTDERVLRCHQRDQGCALESQILAILPSPPLRRANDGLDNYAGYRRPRQSALGSGDHVANLYPLPQ